MSDWRARATEPTKQEREVLEGLPRTLMDQLEAATEPLDIEVQRVAFAPARRMGLGVPVGGLLTVVAVLVLMVWSRPKASFQSEGAAPIQVVERGPDTRILQLDGRRTYDVAPVRPAGVFSVVVEDVTVTVLGTLFVVEASGGDVVVEVTEGRVQVDHPWGRDVLSRGDRWSRAAARRPWPVVALGGVLQASRTERRPVGRVVSPPEERPVAANQKRPELSDSAWFAQLLDRFESNERSLELVGELGLFITEAQRPSLIEEAEVLALLVGAVNWPARSALDALDAWALRHPRHPDQLRILVAKVQVAEQRLGRCDLALSTYDQLIDGTSGRLKDEMTYRRKRCMDQLGGTGHE